MFEIVVIACAVAFVVGVVEWWRGPEIPRR